MSPQSSSEGGDTHAILLCWLFVHVCVACIEIVGPARERARVAAARKSALSSTGSPKEGPDDLRKRARRKQKEREIKKQQLEKQAFQKKIEGIKQARLFVLSLSFCFSIFFVVFGFCCFRV